MQDTASTIVLATSTTAEQVLSGLRNSVRRKREKSTIEANYWDWADMTGRKVKPKIGDEIPLVSDKLKFGFVEKLRAWTSMNSF